MNTNTIETLLKVVAWVVGAISGAGVVIALIALVAEYEDSVGWAVPVLVVCAWGAAAALSWAGLWAVVHLLREIAHDQE